MDEGAKEKLDQELRFLKESFDAEVISKEEYEKGKERIEKKLQGNGNNSDNNKFSESQGPEKKEAEAKTESKSEEITEQKKDSEDQQTPAETKEQKKEGKAFKYAVVFIVLTLVVFFGYSLLKQGKSLEKEETKITRFMPVCSSDKDCIQSGRQGACQRHVWRVQHLCNLPDQRRCALHSPLLRRPQPGHRHGLRPHGYLE